MAVGALPFLGSALSFIGGMNDTMAQARQSRENTMLQYQVQKKLQDDAYQKNLEMWHAQNMYNSPEQQMSRFKDAGLNPHLIYGQGSAGLAQAPPAYVPPEVGIRFQAAQPGRVMSETLPMLMQIGSWMQDMRQKEIDINQQLSLFPSIQEKKMLDVDTGRHSLIGKQVSIADMFENFKRKYGAELGLVESPNVYRYGSGVGERDYEVQRKMHEARLSGLKADYFEPALIMKAVLGLGLAGLLGKSVGGKVKAPTKKGGPKPVHYRESETIKRVGRSRTHTRSWIGE